MKKILSLTILFAAFILSSCTKGEEAGDLPGSWELLSIERHGKAEVTKGKKYYWHERRGLLELYCPYEDTEIFANIRQNGNMMEITNINFPSSYSQAGDDSQWVTFATREALFPWGIWAEETESGKKVKATFYIEVLNEDRMILASDSSRLVFRKF